MRTTTPENNIRTLTGSLGIAGTTGTTGTAGTASAWLFELFSTNQEKVLSIDC